MCTIKINEIEILLLLTSLFYTRNYVHNVYLRRIGSLLYSNLHITNMPINPEPQNVEECRNRNDWPKWKEAMQVE